MSILLLILIVFLLVIVYVVATYNQLVTIKKSRIKNAIQEIGNQLKRQASLIPNLTEAVKGYLRHEKEIFEKITEARKTVANALKVNDPQKMIDASAQLQSALNPIRVVLESTPEIKGSQPTIKLMDELRDTADKLTYARRTLIDLVADYNRLVVTIPSKLVAAAFGFSQEPGLKMPEVGEHLEVTSQELETPKIKL